MEKYYSQLGQDKFIDEFFEKKQEGTFIDIGAHDGKSASNTFFLEEQRNWRGICIEPGINEFKLLNSNRRSINLNVCISNYDGESDFTYIEGYANMLSGLDESYNQQHKMRIQNEVNQYPAGTKVGGLTSNGSGYKASTPSLNVSTAQPGQLTLGTNNSNLQGGVENLMQGTSPSLQ